MGIDTINNKEMIKFFDQFDPVKRKYALKKGIYDKNLSQEEIKRYRCLEQLESIQQNTVLTKVSYGETRKTLDMVYDDAEVSDDIIKIYDVIKNRIIDQYICIDGLERLFSERYVEFEWEMHLGIDYKNHDMEYYRDHFVHQMRNLFCLEKFLCGEGENERGLGWYEKVKNTLADPMNSKVSRYVTNCVEQQDMMGNIHALERYLDNLAKSEGLGKFKVFDTSHKNMVEFYYRNIIYMSCYMAALFHDIGYPEVYNSRNQRRIIEYIANLYNTETSGYNYPRLRALLGNSLLFRVVPFEEIQSRMMQDKADHGVVSAIMFLMHFYENGSIHRLEIYKKCAVELAALAIYNHTNDYSYKNTIKKDGYARASFRANPVSYLLRLCDDLQEWGRVYFEVSHNSNIILCKKCKTPIVKKINQDNGKFFYVCNCNRDEKDKEGVFDLLFDSRDNFHYRRIYNVAVCESLNLCSDNQGKEVFFQLDYQLGKLLHIAYVNPRYAKYRAKELKKLKTLLDYQFELPYMYLLYFMSANPILIKAYILFQFLEKYKKCGMSAIRSELEGLVKKSKKDGKFNGKVLEDQLVKLQSMVFDIIREIGLQTGFFYQSCDEKIKKVIENSLYLYEKLIIFMILCRELNSFNIPEEKAEDMYEEIFDLMPRKIKDYESDGDLLQLIKDAILQCSRMYNESDLKEKPGRYYEQFISSDYTYGCIERFVDAEKYTPVTWLSDIKDEYIDAFTDLIVFNKILEIMNMSESTLI